MAFVLFNLAHAWHHTALVECNHQWGKSRTHHIEQSSHNIRSNTSFLHAVQQPCQSAITSNILAHTVSPFKRLQPLFKFQRAKLASRMIPRLVAIVLGRNSFPTTGFTTTNVENLAVFFPFIFFFFNLQHLTV